MDKIQKNMNMTFKKGEFFKLFGKILFKFLSKKGNKKWVAQL